MKTASLTGRAAVVSFALLFTFLLAWHLATCGSKTVHHMNPEYAKLMGATATQGKSAMPGPIDVGAKLWEHLRRPFYDNGPNDKGVSTCLFDRASDDRISACDAGSDTGRFPDRHVAVDGQGARSIHSGAQANLAARLDAARALHDQGLEPVGDLRDFHLFAVADNDQYRLRRRRRAARMAERRKDA